MKVVRNLAFALSLLAFVSCGNSTASEGECKDSLKCKEQGCMDKKDKCDKADGNAVVENIMSRRSIRKYKDLAVDREVLKKIMLCGINAPNALNRQSWEVRVVDKPEIQEEIKAVMAATGNDFAKECFRGAPVWVFIARDKNFEFSTIDCGLMAENIVLSAHSMGIGSVCLGSPVRMVLDSPEKDKALDILGFSPDYELCICIGLGYPDETPDAKPRDISKVKFVD